MRAGRSGKNSAISTGKFISRAGRRDARLVLAARLLGQADPCRSSALEQRERRGHDVGHDARALRAAGHEQRAAARRRVGIRRRGGGDAPPGGPDCRCSGSSLASLRRRPSDSGKPQAISVTRGLRKRLARPITAFCSCRTLGIAEQRGGEQRRHRRIAAEADDGARPDAPAACTSAAATPAPERRPPRAPC